MNKHLICAWVIKNSISTIAWVALAIVFNKWWIALFGILFISDLKTMNKTCRVCDRCGEHSPYADNQKEALEKEKNAGWFHDGNLDYCPSCRKEMNK